mgnify:CR=1 FL=1
MLRVYSYTYTARRLHFSVTVDARKHRVLLSELRLANCDQPTKIKKLKVGSEKRPKHSNISPPTAPPLARSHAIRLRGHCSEKRCRRLPPRCAEGRASRGGTTTGGCALGSGVVVRHLRRRSSCAASGLDVARVALSWLFPHLSCPHMVMGLVQGCTVGVRWGCGGCGGEVLWWWEGCRAGGH